MTTPAMVERWDNLVTANALVLKARLLAAQDRAPEAAALYRTLQFRYSHSRLVDSLKGEMAALP